jgi:hypothetical protein
MSAAMPDMSAVRRIRRQHHRNEHKEYCKKHARHLFHSSLLPNSLP